MVGKERKPTKRLDGNVSRRRRRRTESPEASSSSRIKRSERRKSENRNRSKSRSRNESKHRRSKSEPNKIKIRKRRSLQKLPGHEEKVDSLRRKSNKVDSTLDLNENKLRRNRSRRKIQPISRTSKNVKDGDNSLKGNSENGGRTRKKRRSKSKRREMVAEEPEPPSRMRRSRTIPTKSRKKPHSLPPLSRTPKSPIERSRTAEEGRQLRRLIGSPPPAGLLSRRSSGSSDPERRSWGGSDSDRPNSSSENRWDRPLSSSADRHEERIRFSSSSRRFDDDERSIYTPASSLENSHPRITINKAPRSRSNSTETERFYRNNDNIIVSASPSGKSFGSYGSLIMSTSSLSLNSSLALPPKLVSFRAENGSRAVQEWIGDDRSSAGSSTRSYTSLFRRNSTPSSIRDLPSPLEGTDPLDVDYERYPNSRTKRKLKPLRK